MYFNTYDLYKRLAISGSEEYEIKLMGEISCESLTGYAIEDITIEHDIEQINATGIITRY